MKEITKSFIRIEKWDFMTKSTRNVFYFALLFIMYALVDYCFGTEIMWITNTIYAICATAIGHFFVKGII